MSATDDARAARTEGGRPLEEYGVVGDMRSIALVASDGSIDWCCWPRFDSGSLFGALLDPDGGAWAIRPEGRADGSGPGGRQTYLSGTNVLVTRIPTATGLIEIEDFMTVAEERRRLVRRVHGLRGSVRMQMRLSPRPDYGRTTATLTAHDEPGRADQLVEIDAGAYRLDLRSTVELHVDGADVVAEFDVAEDELVQFVLGEPGIDLTDDCGAADTTDFWKRWTELSTYRGRWREVVERSALTLKLLIHEPTGGIIAAATTSIPEELGGVRNWDYRYVWIRDAAFTLYALLRLGHTDEARAFTGWLLDRLVGCDADGIERPPLSPLYDLDGHDRSEEIELDHWAGYADSRPVRIGNAASEQTQLDIYGELIDSMYLADKHGEGLDLAAWDQIRRLVRWVIDNWRSAGSGMWEARSEPARYTTSLLLCWVAVERAMRMSRQRGRPAPEHEWRAARDEIHAEILERGWNDELASFTQTLDGDDLDASILLAPLLKFIPGTDPRWESTLRVLDERLAHGPLVDRYDSDDGIPGDEGAFLCCSFWYVEALARAGHVDRAHHLFDQMLSYAGPLGLFSEEVGPDGRLLGNFPQALTHLSLISAALYLDEALDAR